MHRRHVSGTTRRSGRLSERLRRLEDRLEETEQRVVQLENTMRGIVREANGISVGGPCKCGESLLIVRERTMYCPSCQYQQTM